MSLLSLTCLLPALLPSHPTYAVLNKIPIGGDGGWDCLEVDSASHRLFVSRGTHVMVVDVEANKVVGDIPDTNGVHDIALVNKVGKGYTSNGRDNTVTVFDLKTLKEQKRIKVGDRPDVMCYDPGTKRLFVFNGGGNDATAIDVSKDEVVGTVKLGVRSGRGQDGPLREPRRQEPDSTNRSQDLDGRRYLASCSR